jgi:4-hydroxy-3-polyprenylbenzoate decarboxylase
MPPEAPLSAHIVVALTGASGPIYGIRLVEELLTRAHDVELVASPASLLLLKEEMGVALDARTDGAEKALEAYILGRVRRGAGKGAGKGRGKAKAAQGVLRCFRHDDLGAAMASGSSLRRTMAVCPCSMGTLARIAAGVSGNLIERTADTVLKERGTLVLVPRETPLSTIHLENMLKLSRCGAVVLPAMPAFYPRPSAIEDMVDFVVGKVLDALGVENSLYARWKIT